MQHFATADLMNSMTGNPIEYLEFLRVDDLSAGLYHLKAGNSDPQKPHDEDEIYYVLAGSAQFTGGDETVNIGTGSVLYVAAGETHKFHDIEQDLTLLVFFAAGKKTGN